VEFFSARKRITLTFVIITSLVASIYRIFLIKSNLEVSPSADDFNYYLEDSLPIKVFAIIIGCLILVYILFALYTGRRLKNCLITGDPSVVFTSSLSGFLILGSIFYYVFYYIKDKSELDFFVIAILVTGLFSAVYFLLSASNKSEVNNSALKWFSIAPIVCLSLRLLNDFIRQSTSHNPSSSAYLLLSIIAFMLFFLAEGKIRMGSGNITLYYMFGSLSILLSLIYALPTLFLAAFWLFPTNFTTIYSAVDLTIVMYITARLCRLKCSLKQDNIMATVPAKES